MFSHYERVKSAVFQRFCEYVRAYAFIGDDCRDPEFHLLSPRLVAEQMCPAAPFDCLPVTSSTQCRIMSRVQDLFHMARCKLRILPAQEEEAAVPWDYCERMTDSASQKVDLDLRLVGYFVAVADHRHFDRAARRAAVVEPADPPSGAADRRPPV